MRLSQQYLAFPLKVTKSQKKLSENIILNYNIIGLKVEDIDFAHCFEDGAEVNIPYEIKPPFHKVYIQDFGNLPSIHISIRSVLCTHLKIFASNFHSFP